MIELCISFASENFHIPIFPFLHCVSGFSKYPHWPLHTTIDLKKYRETGSILNGTEGSQYNPDQESDPNSLSDILKGKDQPDVRDTEGGEKERKQTVR